MTLKKLLSYILISLFFIGSYTTLSANNTNWLDESLDDITIKNIDSKFNNSLSQKLNINPSFYSFKDYWDEHFKATFATYYGAGINHKRYFYTLRLNYEETFNEKLKVFLGLNYRSLRLDTNVSVPSEEVDMFGYSQDSIIEETLNFNYFKFSQAYAQYSISDKWLLSAGRQSIVWGQMGVFSPIDFFLLPIDINESGFTVQKIDNRLPQTVTLATWFPIENLEVTGYYFPFFEVSNFIDDMFSLDNGLSIRYTKPSNDQASYALRSLYHWDTFTIGATVYRGWSNYPFINSRYLNGINNDTTESFEYFKKDLSFGLELSKQHNQTKYSIEYFNDTYRTLVNTSDLIDKVDFLRNNDNQLGLNQRWQWIAIGMDGDYDRGFINLYLYNVRFQEKTADQGFNQTYLNNQANSFQSLTFPSFNVGLYLDSDKETLTGIGVGFFQGSAGGVVYYKNKITESMSFGVSAEMLFEINDISYLAAIQKEANDSQFKQYLFMEPKLRVGMNYQF
ncbi:hypothetical protein DID75_04610 [Candidatus Marinamargulisbacteria bacterium SCGC AG-410-N11]|nr:hypothetical protein DID75_04610 [Candidatus Marinamargulisbacteria bacterium SCGC AG-410-N11]